MKGFKKIIEIAICMILTMLIAGCGEHQTKGVAKEIKVTDSDLVVSTEEEFANALESAKPGDQILLHEGTYVGHFEVLVSGTEKEPIIIASYPGEKATLTIEENSNGAALRFENCEYVHVQDLLFHDIRAEEAYGVVINGGVSYVTICNCEFSNIETTAPGTLYECEGGANAVILYNETKDTVHHITIDGNKVHDNINGWSENLSVAGNCEYVYINNNEVYDCTNIGIDFYGNAEYCPYPELDQARHCECIGNTVYNCNSFYAANAGIYVDGSYDVLIENNETYNNFYGIEVGSEEWRDYYTDEKRVHNIVVRNNYTHDNTECGMRIGGYTNDEYTGIVYDCQFENNRFENNVNEIILAKCDKITFKNNTFANGLKTEDALVYDEEIDSSKITNITCID